MLGFVLRRLVIAVPTLLAVVTLSFLLMRLAPGGPFDLERPLEAKAMENLARLYQLDQPLYRQYLGYLGALLKGDFGPSLSIRDFSIGELFAQGLPVSMRLGAAALAAALLIGIPLGSLAAFRRNRGLDHAVMGFATLGITIPGFVVAPLLQIAFGLGLAWLPVGGWGSGSWRHGVLPVVTLALPQIAIIARLTRVAMVEVLRSNPIRTLHALGLSGWTVALHALRAALMPVISHLGPAAAAWLTGSVVVETIFAIPGIGRYFVGGALNRDYTLVMGTVVVIAILVLALNLVVDVLQAMLDPRVRLD